MKIKDIKTSELIPYDNNPRLNDGAVEAVANSIKEFGFKVPIVVDKNLVVVCGHTRLKAAIKLKLDTVPVIIADDLSEEKIKAFRLADNKVSELAEWDVDKLNAELKELIDSDINMSEFGFDDMPEIDFNTGEVQEDGYEIPEELPCRAKLGDIYQLGNHRLMCGDSTSIDNVRSLMGGGASRYAFN